MFENYDMMRIGLVLSGASLALLWAQSAWSAPSAARSAGTCSAHHEEGEQLRAAGHLRKARSAYAACAPSSCGSFISQQCRSALQQIESDQPTVIPVVTGPHGEQLVEVHVSADGELLTARIDGRGVAVDPGMRELVFSTERGVVYSEKVLILEGQRNRVISVVLKEAAPGSGSDASNAAASNAAASNAAASNAAASNTVSANAVSSSAAATPVTATPAKTLSKPAAEGDAASMQASAPETEQQLPARAGEAEGPGLFPYILGGAGVAAIGGSFLLAHWGGESNDSLDACKPNCSRASVDHVSNMYVAADVSLGVGVVALGVATWLYFSQAGSERPPADQAYRFEVRPTASGAFATVGRPF